MSFWSLLICFSRALETNRYNHITATYFLLAERILREKQEKEIQTRSASPSNIKAQFRWENTFIDINKLPFWNRELSVDAS